MTAWFIPDAYIPPRSTGERSHESLCVLNPTEEDAQIHIEALFEHASPQLSAPIAIRAKSCGHLRTDDPARVGGLALPVGVPYGLVVRSSSRGLSLQYSRLDTTQAAYSLMSVIPERGSAP